MFLKNSSSAFASTATSASGSSSSLTANIWLYFRFSLLLALRSNSCSACVEGCSDDSNSEVVAVVPLPGTKGLRYGFGVLERGSGSGDISVENILLV